jgi:trans-aconitate 2-methyltransferase
MATSSMISTDWDPEAYHRLSEPQFERGRKMLKVLALRGDERILDAGCGTGRVTAELAERLPHGQVIAVDASPKMLAKAREFLEPKYGARVTFLQADMSELPMIESVDGIFSSAAIHWVKDHRKLFRSFFMALRKTGWLMAQCSGGGNLSRVMHPVSKLMMREPYAKYFEGWNDPREYVDERTTADRLRVAGFEDVEVGLQESPVVMKSREDYIEYLRMMTLHRHVALLPTELADKFLNELADDAEKQGGYVLDYWRLNMTALKPEWPRVSTGRVWKLQRE